MVRRCNGVIVRRLVTHQGECCPESMPSMVFCISRATSMPASSFSVIMRWFSFIIFALVGSWVYHRLLRMLTVESEVDQSSKAMTPTFQTSNIAAGEEGMAVVKWVDRLMKRHRLKINR